MRIASLLLSVTLFSIGVSAPIPSPESPQAWRGRCIRC